MTVGIEYDVTWIQALKYYSDSMQAGEGDNLCATSTENKREIARGTYYF